jgi:glycosyltransferase involved in cell wall biosynthesis
MTVLFATNHSYPPHSVGGSESSMHDLCLTLRELGVDVAVLSSLFGWPIARWRGRWLSHRHGAELRRDESLGYPVFRAGKPSDAARELVQELRPSVTVIQAGRPLVLADHFTALDVPCVVYLRDASFHDLGGAVRDRPDVRYLATSRDLVRRFAQAFGIVPLDIPPVVRLERYLVDSTRENVTFVCPVPQKGVGIAMGLAARRPDIPFVFVESWRLHPVRRLLLNRRIRAAANITFRGSTNDMRSVYGSAKVVLVPSRWPEAWGRVVSEAQVSGIPVLASNAGGLPESVGEGGILVDGNAGLNEWENALARMWDDPAEYERVAERARQHARRPEFQPRALASRFLAVLSDLVGSNTGGREPSTATAGR